MREIVARLEGQERTKAEDISLSMLAVQCPAVKDVSFQEAYEIHERYDLMWKNLRAKYELEADESYLFCRETGVIFRDLEE